MARRVYSQNARGDAEAKIHRIKCRLEDIQVLMGKYESLMKFHYGHVGDLSYVLDLLDQTYEFICKGED